MRFLPFVAVAAFVLSGCASNPENASGTQSVTTITDPNDTSYLQNGTDQGFHLHDYWGGQNRLTVMDQRQNNQFLLNGGAYGAITFLPADEAVVPQGTASVETTVTWRDISPGMYGPLELWVKTQAQQEELFVSEIKSGVPVLLETALDDADLPHQMISAWEFVIHIRSPPNQPSQPLTGQARSFDLEITVKADAIRGLELPLFPPHPDRWHNATELPLLKAAAGDTLLWVSQPPSCSFCSGGIYIVSPDSGMLVPVDAGAVEVTMSYSKDTPTGLRLLYHAADSRKWAAAPIVSDAGGVRVHVIPAQANGDGPYAVQSLWEFYFGFEGGNGPYRGAWELSARVLKEAPV